MKLNLNLIEIPVGMPQSKSVIFLREAETFDTANCLLYCPYPELKFGH
jgi:hypothetical protein